MPVLYEHSTSVCAVKVRLTLLEKGIEYESRFVDLRRGDQFSPEYRKIHSGAVVPAHAIAFRKDYRTPDAIEARMAKIPDPRRRARQRAVYEEGLDASLAADAARDMDALFARMDDTLAHGPWLGGGLYSLADAAATPYANRMNDLGLFDIWAGRYARVAGWFERIRARPSYRTGIADRVTDDDRDRLAPMEDDAPARVRAILGG